MQNMRHPDPQVSNEAVSNLIAMKRRNRENRRDDLGQRVRRLEELAEGREPAAAGDAKPGRIVYGPLVRKYAAELGVNLDAFSLLHSVHVLESLTRGQLGPSVLAEVLA
jgi:hypothetical protein